MNIPLNTFTILSQRPIQILSGRRIKNTEQLLENAGMPATRKWLMKVSQLEEFEIRPLIVAADISRIKGMSLNVIQELATMSIIKNVKSFSLMDSENLLNYLLLANPEQNKAITLSEISMWQKQAKALPALLIWNIDNVNDFEMIQEAQNEHSRRQYASFRKAVMRIILFVVAISILIRIGADIYQWSHLKMSLIDSLYEYWIPVWFVFLSQLDLYIIAFLPLILAIFAFSEINYFYRKFIKPALTRNLAVRRQVFKYTLIDIKIGKYIILFCFLLICLLPIIAIVVNLNIHVQQTQGLLENYEAQDIFVEFLVRTARLVLIGGFLITSLIVVYRWKALNPQSVIEKKAFSILMADQLALTILMAICIIIPMSLAYTVKPIHSIWVQGIIFPLVDHANGIGLNYATENFIRYSIIDANNLDLQKFNALESIIRLNGSLFVVGLMAVFLILPSFLIKDFNSVIYSILMILIASSSESFLLRLGPLIGYAKNSLLYLLVAILLILINSSAFQIIESSIEKYKDCQSCAMRNSDDAHYCSNCGTKLE